METSVAKDSGRTDSASKLIHASAERIYAAFADGAALMAWLPPPNMTGRVFEYDFREGGRYRIELRSSDGGKGAGKTTGDSDVSSGSFLELTQAAPCASRSNSNPMIPS